MKKIKWATHKSLFGQIATSACLVGGSAGLIFGISAGTFKINYFNLNNSQNRLKAALSTNYYSQNINSQWNMNAKGSIPAFAQPTEQYFISNPGDKTSAPTAWWKSLHGEDATPLYQDKYGINPSQMSLNTPQGTSIGSAEAMRKKYATLIIDGATHTALDRSFNQSVFNGIANFNQNKVHKVAGMDEAQVLKPAQDSTQEFVNVYRAAAKETRFLALAGFNHVTPLNALGKQKGAVVDYSDDERIRDIGMLLIDGDVSNNQNMASVLFRSDQPAFLTGVATCMYFMNNLSIYHEGYRNLSVAAYGGTPIPTVVVYMGGFQRGIEFFNNFILKEKVLEDDLIYYFTESITSDLLEKMIEASRYKKDLEELKGTSPSAEVVEKMQKALYNEYSVKMIKLGDYGTHFSGSFAAGDAIGISKQLLNRGASAIIAVAGPQSLDTAQEIMNQNSNCIVIGVDCPMEDSDYQKPFRKSSYVDHTVAPDKTTSTQAGNIIKFSAVKDMTSVTEKVIRNAADGKNWDITNDKPWRTATPIPAWDAETEAIPESYLAYALDNTDPDNPVFDVIGLADYHSGINTHVLNIPAEHVEDGITYKLRAIRQPATAAEEQKASLHFNALSLQNIDTLKISGDFTTKVQFGAKAFDFTKKGPKSESPATEEDMKRSGFKYIDLSDLSAFNISFESDTCKPFDGIADYASSQAFKKGVIKFDSDASDEALEDICYKMFQSSASVRTDWPIVEADPYKSICTFGFKTCGNIENGLISISWDGWPFLVQALKELRYVDKIGGSPVTFNKMWNLAAQQYANERSTETELAEFFDAAKKATWDGSPDAQGKPTVPVLCTFNRESIFYKYYSHTMAILGRFLNRARLSFPVEMTVLLDKSGKPYIPEQGHSLTILEWLKANMYFVA